ncbi:unnamed protein product [Heligmosomoides polygyrus]|uniref:Uncharacterized protein n=1 Tax=Heligmosomoides polygyrus TaxID=6339 RepID=A0A183G1V5_HELPZ|nr:unnamed protein product [Heligmosomoides polygyrus]
MMSDRLFPVTRGSSNQMTSTGVSDIYVVVCQPPPFKEPSYITSLALDSCQRMVLLIAKHWKLADWPTGWLAVSV